MRGRKGVNVRTNQKPGRAQITHDAKPGGEKKLNIYIYFFVKSYFIQLSCEVLGQREQMFLKYFKINAFSFK